MTSERAKRASRSNTRRGNHSESSNCALCDRQAILTLFSKTVIKKRMTSISDGAFRPLDSPDKRLKMSIAHVEGESVGFMKCEVIIDASVEEVAAYNYMYTSRKRTRKGDSKETLLRDATNVNEVSDRCVMCRFLSAVQNRPKQCRNCAARCCALHTEEARACWLW